MVVLQERLCAFPNLNGSSSGEEEYNQDFMLKTD